MRRALICLALAGCGRGPLAHDHASRPVEGATAPVGRFGSALVGLIVDPATSEEVQVWIYLRGTWTLDSAFLETRKGRLEGRFWYPSGGRPVAVFKRPGRLDGRIFLHLVGTADGKPVEQRYELTEAVR